MDTKSNSSNEADEVRRLRDQIKNLKLENNLLKQSQTKQVGLTSVKGFDNSPNAEHVNEDILNEILDISKEDLSHEDTWLYVSNSLGHCSNSDPTTSDLIKWLRNDVDNNRDYEFQILRRMLVTKIEELRQGSRRNNIDTRTFTRPKKQMSRPGLRTMVDSPLSEFRELMPKLSESMTPFENVDETSMPLNSTFTSNTLVGLGSTVHNANFQKRGGCMPSTRYQQVESTKHILKAPQVKNCVLRRSEDTGLESIIQEERTTRFNTTFSKILSEPHLNTSTELRIMSPNLDHMGLQLRNSIPNALNVTFNKSDRTSGVMEANGYNNGMIRRTLEMNAAYCDLVSPVSGNGTSADVRKRAASCDSLDDDDSSQSDNSAGANRRLLNHEGDVHSIARLQEESLHVAMSTPRSNFKTDAFDDEMPSPIHARTADVHGYHSDHSDHSSVAKSSRSSQMSSPSGSLRGSTNMLPTESARAKLELPRMKPVSDMLSGRRGRHAGLRPPSTRPATSGLPRPTTNIPRASSRIPAPKVRKPASDCKQSNWMEGCY